MVNTSSADAAKINALQVNGVAIHVWPDRYAK
jgi:hypothetical protein